MTRERRLDILAIIVFALGFSGILGNIAGIPFLTVFGRAVAVSPVPTPYTRVDKIPPAEADRMLAFACEEPGGPEVWHYWNHQFRNSLPGPHRRTCSILVFFAMAQQPNRSSAIQSRFERMNQYLFCNGGPLAKAAGCSDRITGVNFRWVEKDDNGFATPLQMRQACLK